MTVSYSAEVATSRGFGCFWKLLFRWRGSIYKLLWPDLSLYLFIYYFLSIIYRFVLSEAQRRYFEKVSIYCKTYGDLIPVSFILGFYVSIVVKRWWDSFNCIPWPDTLAFFVSAYIHGQDERGRLMRRSIMRYANLAFVITMSCISPCVKKRFPTMDHLVEAGILLPTEKKIMEQLKTPHPTYWMPLVWASSIAIRARKEGRIRDDFALNTLIESIASYRSLCGGLYNYDWISIPLVYTQVVTLVVYTFFVATLMGRQYLDPAQKHIGYEVDLYIPIFNFLQFFFYMGWLKVAETLVNPFGEDDDDFEVNWVIDRDIQVSYLIVDEMHQEHPELIKDQYWDEVLPDLPYTAASMPFYTEAPKGSAANLIIPAHEAEFVPLETLVEDDDELDNVKVNGIPFIASHARNHLTHNLSGSSYSGISKLGRSFHPMSYERKGILNLMQDFFSSRDNVGKDLLSRESSVRKKLYKTQSKDSTVDPSPSCDTSGPPTPEELRERMRGFNDDIFRLSDLSLADSRGTGIAQSPGIFSNVQVTDFFNRMKPERPHQMNLSNQVSSPKVLTPRSDDDECNKSLKKKRTNSLRQFFQSAKHRGSQKSLANSLHRDHGGSKHTLPPDNEDTLKYGDDIFDLSFDEDPSLHNSDEEITVREANPVPQNISKSNIDIGRRDSNASEPISFKHPRKSLPHVFNASPENVNVGKMAKEPSTSTLVPGEGSLGNTPPSAGKNGSNGTKSSSSGGEKNTSDDTDVSSLHSTPSPAKTAEMSQLQKRLFSKLKPTRTVSLHLNETKKEDNTRFSGLQKFYKRRRSQSFFRTVSQPVSPTEVGSPTSAHGGLFSRRMSKEGKSPSTVTFSQSGLMRRLSRDSESLNIPSTSRRSLFSRRRSKEAELPHILTSSQGGLLSRRMSKEIESPGAVTFAPSGILGRQMSKEIGSPNSIQSGLHSRRMSKEVESPTSIQSGLHSRQMSKEIESPSDATSLQGDLLSRQSSKEEKAAEKPSKSIQIQENPEIIIVENFVEEKNRKNKIISDV